MFQAKNSLLALPAGIRQENSFHETRSPDLQKSNPNLELKSNIRLKIPGTSSFDILTAKKNFQLHFPLLTLNLLVQLQTLLAMATRLR